MGTTGFYCPDCKKDVSGTATACPGCGAVRPDAGWTKKWESRNPRIAAAFGLALLVAIAFSTWRFVQWVEAPSAPSFPAVGQDAVVPPDVLLCPDKAVLSAFLSDLQKADAAHDDIGKMHALSAAEYAGCYTEQGPHEAKVIDLDGILVRLAQLRMPDASSAWTGAAELKTAPSASHFPVGSTSKQPDQVAQSDVFPADGPAWADLKPQQRAYLSNNGGGDTSHLAAYLSEHDLASWCTLGDPKSVNLNPGELVTVERIIQDNMFGANGGGCLGTGVEISLAGKHYWVMPSDLIPVFPNGASVVLNKAEGMASRSGNATTFLPKGTPAQVVRQDEGPEGQSTADLLVRISPNSRKFPGKQFWVDAQLQAFWWIAKRP
ncbi:MAG: hypothetical protein ACYDHY_18210 [Acidiferrobacterales bacterium]